MRRLSGDTAKDKVRLVGPFFVFGPWRNRMVQSHSLAEKLGNDARPVSSSSSGFISPTEIRDSQPHTLVLVKDRDTGEESGYAIVPSCQADPEAGFISEESPVGGVLKGARTGQYVTIDTPSGSLRLQVLSCTTYEGR